MNRLKIACYIFLFYFLTMAPQLIAADIVFVTATAKGDYYFKMSASGRSMSKMEGTAFRVKAGDRDEVLWRTTGWFADTVFLSPDGTKLVRVEEDMMYLYENGLVLASRSAKSTSLGDRIIIDASRSGFSADERDFRLVTASGKTEIFSLSDEKLSDEKLSLEQPSIERKGKPGLVGLKTVAQRVESTVSYDRSVRNYAEVRVNVDGQNRGSRSTVENSVSGRQSASTLIGVQTTADTDSVNTSKQAYTPAAEHREDPQHAQQPQQAQQQVHGASDPIKNHGVFECRVEAKLYASATRKKVTSTRQIHQSGSTQEIAADRAMAYCEGVVGAGSKLPRGRCELRECTN